MRITQNACSRTLVYENTTVKILPKVILYLNFNSATAGKISKSTILSWSKNDLTWSKNEKRVQTRMVLLKFFSAMLGLLETSIQNLWLYLHQNDLIKQPLRVQNFNFEVRLQKGLHYFQTSRYLVNDLKFQKQCIEVKKKCRES